MNTKVAITAIFITLAGLLGAQNVGVKSNRCLDSESPASMEALAGDARSALLAL